ncbi:MAG: plasmid pRiA4b ORF-3 family protein [Desulfohalobiaceae bacterium]|nr:plasmid pRiA4b ORF-3 family protein [Desulfohalobiaceae bacterium]
MCKQRIDKNGPGTILRDFEILLETIGPEGVRVAGKTQQFISETLEALNARLTHPIAIDFKRPRQKSYPNIHGLYLILRSSGLGIVQSSKKSQRLVLNEPVLQVWNNLNAEEQYCTLLESWLIRGNPGIIGEKSFPGGPWILDCRQFLKRITKHGLDTIEQNSLNTIRFTVGLHGVALMRFFGLLSLEEFKPEQGKGWNARMYRTAYGEALFDVLWKLFWANDDVFFFTMDSTKSKETCGILQPALSPFFHGWHKNLHLPDQDFKPGLYTFKISRGKDCWRRILVSGRESLETLSLAIQSAFDFDNDHLHLFECKGRFGQPLQILHPDMDEGDLFSNEVLVGNLNLEPGNSLLYVFDFGDAWKFKLVVEAIDPPDSKALTPRVTARHGTSPEQYA